MPSHLLSFYEMLMVSHFDFISFKEKLYQVVSEKEVVDSYEGNYGVFGFASSLCLLNYGDIFIIVALFTLTYILLVFANKLLEKIQKQNSL